MKKNIWMRLLVSVMLLALLATMMVACKKDPVDDPDDDDNEGTTILHPDYPAPAPEEDSEDIGGDDEDKLESPQGGGAVGLVYTDKVTIDLSEKKATLRFDNPSRSTNNMSLELLIQDVVVLKSGTLTPGKRVTSLDVEEAALAQLTAGVYGSTSNAKFRVYFYDPVTNERAVVNSEIAVTGTVQE
jgi:hypothetical protein